MSKSEKGAKAGRESVGEAFTPVMSVKQWRAGEARHNSTGDMAMARKVAFSVLTKTHADLRQLVLSKDGEKIALGMARTVSGFIYQTEVVIEMSKVSLARLMLVLDQLGRQPQPAERNRSRKRSSRGQRSSRS